MASGVAVSATAGVIWAAIAPGVASMAGAEVDAASTSHVHDVVTAVTREAAIASRLLSTAIPPTIASRLLREPPPSPLRLDVRPADSDVRHARQVEAAFTLVATAALPSRLLPRPRGCSSARPFCMQLAL